MGISICCLMKVGNHGKLRFVACFVQKVADMEADCAFSDELRFGNFFGILSFQDFHQNFGLLCRQVVTMAISSESIFALRFCNLHFGGRSGSL